MIGFTPEDLRRHLPGPQIQRATSPQADALRAQLSEQADELGEERCSHDSKQALRSHSFVPWWGQRMILRSDQGVRVVVAARQQGKSLLANYVALQVALEEPGSFSALLVPTLLHARPAIETMLRLTREIKGCRWKVDEARMVFSNGSTWNVFSADRPESIRGPKISGVLWVDEAAYLRKAAWEAGLGGFTASANPRKLLTTTPAGKNWVYDEFVSSDPENESFRFRAGDSPYTNMEEVLRCRAKMSPERAAQEYEAEFVDALILAFPDASGLFVGSFPDRSGEKAPKNTLGIDLGREQDWTVCTLVNRWGEAEIVGRWQHVTWPETESRVLDLITERSVGLCCVDKSYVGSYLVDRLEALGHKVLAVSTHVRGQKADVVELTRADVQHERLWVLKNEHHDQLAYELSRFQGTKKIHQGRELVTYECPQLKGEHDDCVVSLCLANWGRTHGWPEEEEYDPTNDMLWTIEVNRRIQQKLYNPTFPAFGYRPVVPRGGFRRGFGVL